MSMDISKVGALLHIAEKAAAHGTTLSGIYTEAMAELGAVNAEVIKGQQAKAAQEKIEVAKAEQAARDKAEAPKVPPPKSFVPETKSNGNETERRV